MPLLLLLLLTILTGCSQPPAAVPQTKQNASQQPWYGEAVEKLKTLARDAESALGSGKADQAAALITEGQPISTRLLAVEKPTLAALEAASDLDDLYGRMLLSNKHYGWARLVFQRNVARWKNWKPETPETIRRRTHAEEAIAQCDREMVK